MEFSWSALWNITDETPDNCEMFLNYSGMKLFLECLKVSTPGFLHRNADLSSGDAGAWPGSLAALIYKQYFLRCTNRKEKACTFSSFSHPSTQPVVEQRDKLTLNKSSSLPFLYKVSLQ